MKIYSTFALLAVIIQTTNAVEYLRSVAITSVDFSNMNAPGSTIGSPNVQPCETSDHGKEGLSSDNNSPQQSPVEAIGDDKPQPAGVFDGANLISYDGIINLEPINAKPCDESKDALAPLNPSIKSSPQQGPLDNSGSIHHDQVYNQPDGASDGNVEISVTNVEPTNEKPCEGSNGISGDKSSGTVDGSVSNNDDYNYHDGATDGNLYAYTNVKPTPGSPWESAGTGIWKAKLSPQVAEPQVPVHEGSVGDIYRNHYSDGALDGNQANPQDTPFGAFADNVNGDQPCSKNGAESGDNSLEKVSILVFST